MVEHWRPIDDVLPDREDRNYTNVEDAMLRLEIDHVFNALHDDLTELYYQHWRKGEIDLPWFGHRPSSVQEAKALFDELHGEIFHKRDERMIAKGWERPFSSDEPPEEPLLMRSTKVSIDAALSAIASWDK